MPLSPEEGGMIPPDQHPGNTISADDFQRALNNMVELCSIGLDDTLTNDEGEVADTLAAFRYSGLNDEHMRHLFGWALLRLGKIQAASKAYDQALKGREHGAVAGARFIADVQRVIIHVNN